MDLSSLPPQTWRDWLTANAPRYLLFARSQARSEADAHDLLQEALVEVWRRTPDCPPDDALVFKTLRRRAIDLGRRTDRRKRREQTSPDWWKSPADASVSDAEADADLARAVQALPVPLREVVLLKVWGGQTFRQIADTLAIPQGTAASRYRYALNHLRDQLQPARP